MKQSNDRSGGALRLWDRPVFVFVATVILLILLVMVCVIVYMLPPEATLFDVENNPAAKISQATTDFVANLKEEVTIYWLCEGTPTDDVFSSFLMNYAEAGEKLSLRLINTLEIPEFSDEYTDQKLSDSSLIVESAHRYQVIDMSNMFYYVNEYINYAAGGSEYRMTYAEYENWRTLYGEYMDQSVTYKYFQGEALLTSALDYVTAPYIPHTYLMKPHGDRVMSDALKQRMRTAGISLELLDLENTDRVPIDANCVILFSPETDLTNHEAELLKDYIRGGGSFLLVAGPDTSDFTNLASICALFGMKPSSGIVVDTNKNNYMGETHYLVPVINSQHAATYYLSSQKCQMYMPNAMGILLDSTLPERVSVLPMMGTTESGYRVSKDSARTPLCKPSAQLVAVSAVLQTSTEDGTADNAYFAWFASDDAFVDEVSAAVSYGNYYYLTMTAAWMTADDQFTSTYKTLAAVDLSDPMMEGLTDSTAIVIALIAVVLIPIGLITTGVVVYLKRRHR